MTFVLRVSPPQERNSEANTVQPTIKKDTVTIKRQFKVLTFVSWNKGNALFILNYHLKCLDSFFGFISFFRVNICQLQVSKRVGITKVQRERRRREKWEVTTKRTYNHQLAPGTAQDVLLATFYTFIAVFGVVSDAIVITIVRRTLSTHTSTNYLLLKLAVADLLTFILCPGMCSMTLLYLTSTCSWKGLRGIWSASCLWEMLLFQSPSMSPS